MYDSTVYGDVNLFMLELPIGVDLSKIFGSKIKYWGQRVVITDEIIGVSQLLGACARATPPNVYTYGDTSGEKSISAYQI